MFEFQIRARVKDEVTQVNYVPDQTDQTVMESAGIGWRCRCCRTMHKLCARLAYFLVPQLDPPGEVS